MRVDTIVRERNITFTADAKLHEKIVNGCRKISKKEEIGLRHNFSHAFGQLILDQRFRKFPKWRRKAMAVAQKLRPLSDS